LPESEKVIWLVLIDDLLPDKISFEGVNRRLIHIKTGKICLFKNELEPNKKTILSTREVEVLGLVSKGFASKEIADKLFLSVNTVNNHRQNILEKVSAIFACRAVQIGSTDPFHRLEKGPLIRAALEMLAAREHEMLEQMREASLAGLLIL
jgi:DNA-binding CsgD family transcriptional regulator